VICLTDHEWLSAGPRKSNWMSVEEFLNELRGGMIYECMCRGGHDTSSSFVANVTFE
jgi:hypothetical protein